MRATSLRTTSAGMPPAQAPRFGNGRTITDLAKRIFTEIGIRMGDGDGGGGGGSVGGRTRSRRDPRASVDDIRRSAAAILAQMTDGADGADGADAGDDKPTAKGTVGGSAPVASFGTSGEAPRTAPPKMSVTTTTTAATSPPEDMADGKPSTEEGEGEGEEAEDESSDAPDLFLDDKDRDVLQKVCEIAGIPDDSPQLSRDVEDNEGLRRALLLPSCDGGLGFSAEQAQAFLQRVGTDRAAVSHLGEEALDAEAKRDSDEADAKREVEEAGAEFDEAASSGDVDDDLLALLMLAKRAKEEALKKLEEQRRVELAKEAAAQTAIRRMGVCVVGFQWLRTANGWRCAGGSHFLSGHAVAAEMARGK